MVKTDFGQRAIKWSRLLLAHRELPYDLNVRKGQRFSVAASMLAASICPLVLADARWILAIATALTLLVWVNREFYALLVRRGGFAFALACVPLHVVYFVCAGLGFLVALSERARSR
jgi:hypothetical protein